MRGASPRRAAPLLNLPEALTSATRRTIHFMPQLSAPATPRIDESTARGGGASPRVRRAQPAIAPSPAARGQTFCCVGGGPCCCVGGSERQRREGDQGVF